VTRARFVPVIAVPCDVPRWRIRALDEYPIKLGKPGGRLDSADAPALEPGQPGKGDPLAS
jgi:hypothetical protein